MTQRNYTSVSWEERRAELEARPLLDELPSPSTTNGLGWDEHVSSDRISWEWDYVEFANIDLKTGEVVRGTAHPINPHWGGGATAYDSQAFMDEGFKRWYREIPAEILEHLFDVVRLLLRRSSLAGEPAPSAE